MCSVTPPWLNADDLKETKENHEGCVDKKMNEENRETHDRGSVKSRVRNKKGIDIFGITFLFKVDPDRHVFLIFIFIKVIYNLYIYIYIYHVIFFAKGDQSIAPSLLVRSNLSN